MPHFKRRKRRRGGIVGCCGLCMTRRLKCAHHRIETRQERQARESEAEQKREASKEDKAP